MRTIVLRLGGSVLLGIALVPGALAQVPQGTSFTYQGRLTEAGALANGAYDFQFVLYDSSTGGAQVGPTVTLEDVTVAVGLFTVTLDFGDVFGSEKRFLELGVRPGPDTGPYTPILPRQEVTPGPSAIFSATAADAQGLGGVPASQFVQTDDPRMTDARNPLPGSPDYVQNGTAAQPGVSFNVGGTGAADILNAATQYNLAGVRILGNPGFHNLFAGVDAGASATAKASDSSFFGFGAGGFTESGNFNTFLGSGAGALNVAGSGNTYVGTNAGFYNPSDGNTFVGSSAGYNDFSGSYNTALGAFADIQGASLTNATAIGSGARVFTSNTVVLGRSFDTVMVPGAQTVGGSQSVGGSLAVTGPAQAASMDVSGQYNLNGQRVLGMLGSSNVYVGTGTGPGSFGASNTFAGGNAGQSNTTGSNNSFLGSEAGKANSIGSDNSFFGSSAGASSTASFNSFFGFAAGVFNTSGEMNSFSGSGAGNFNTTGSRNVFFGSNTGHFNTTGDDNTFVGTQADWISFNSVGSADTLLGANSRSFSGIDNSTAIGFRAQVSQSNSMVLGGILGVNGATASTNVGIGTTSPAARLHVVDGASIVLGSSSGCSGFAGLAFASAISASCQNYSIFGGDGNTYINRPSGGSIFFRESNVTQVIIRPGGVLALAALGSAGTTALCRNAAGDVSTCSSSLRYKTDVAPFRGGLEIVERLRPITFTWKANGQRDIGLAAEEVAEVEPLLAFRNGQGEIEGVNYSQLTAVLVNALQQQQAQIDALKALVCQASPQAAPCRD